MVKRRPKAKPKKRTAVQVPAAPVDAPTGPPPQLFARRLALRRRLSVALLQLLSVVLLTVCFPPLDCWYVAYVALVPWVLAVTGAERGRWAMLCCYLAGVVFWAINLHWLLWMALVGYIPLVLYLSVYWLAAGWAVRRAAQRRWPMWIVLPVVWVALEYARAYVISGFPWFYLAHTQYARTSLIQISDVTGQYGVSFLVAMVTGVISDMLAAPLFVPVGGGAALARRNVVGVAVAAAVGAAMLGYGHWRLGQKGHTRPGPVIGVIQEAFPTWLGPRPTAPDETTRQRWEATHPEMFDAHVRMTRAAFAGAGCDVVAWAESMVLRGMNRELLTLDLADLSEAELRSLAMKLSIASPQEVNSKSPGWLRAALMLVIHGRAPGNDDFPDALKMQAMKMRDLSREVGCPILAGGGSVHRNRAAAAWEDQWVVRNSALWFDRSPLSCADHMYSKMHLVPMGEYVPFRESWPWLHRSLRSLVPPVMDQVDPGKSSRPLRLSRGGREWRLAVPICYEGTFARVCRRLVVADGRKRVDVLVNISNDGWFVWRWRPWAGQGSSEHSQHLAHYVFRAVECRVPVVRAVNTGISASIDSNGRIVAEVKRGEVRTAMLAGAMQLGGASKGASTKAAAADKLLSTHGPQVLVDDRVSWYSMVGDVFALTVSFVAALGAVWLVVIGILRKRRGMDEGITG